MSGEGCGWPERHCDFCATVVAATCPDCDALLLTAEDKHEPGCPRSLLTAEERVDVYARHPLLDAWLALEAVAAARRDATEADDLGAVEALDQLRAAEQDIREGRGVSANEARRRLGRPEKGDG